jgi:hypothetical protein
MSSMSAVVWRQRATLKKLSKELRKKMVMTSENNWPPSPLKKDLSAPTISASALPLLCRIWILKQSILVLTVNS